MRRFPLRSKYIEIQKYVQKGSTGLTMNHWRNIRIALAHLRIPWRDPMPILNSTTADTENAHGKLRTYVPISNYDD